MAPLTPQLIVESFIHTFYETLIQQLSSVQSLFANDPKITFLTPDRANNQFKQHNYEDIAVGMQALLLKFCKRIEVVQWNFTVLSDGISINSVVQYKDMREDVVNLTAENFILQSLGIASGYWIKSYTCQIIK